MNTEKISLYTPISHNEFENAFLKSDNKPLLRKNPIISSISSSNFKELLKLPEPNLEIKPKITFDEFLKMGKQLTFGDWTLLIDGDIITLQFGDDRLIYKKLKSYFFSRGPDYLTFLMINGHTFNLGLRYINNIVYIRLATLTVDGDQGLRYDSYVWK